MALLFSVIRPVSISQLGGWSGGAMVLGKLPVPGRPTYLDYSRARAYCACSRCGWGVVGTFFLYLSFLSSFSLSLGDGPMSTEILSQRAAKPKTTNQPSLSCLIELQECWLMNSCKQQAQNIKSYFVVVALLFYVHGKHLRSCRDGQLI